MSRSSIVVYGNCQAEAVAAILGKHETVTEQFDVVYLRSFEHPVEGWDSLDDRDAARCGFLLEQYDAQAPFPFPEKLPSGAPRVTFPSADLHLLWPLASVNPANVPEPPDFPHGRFVYGDAAVIRQIEAGLDAQDILTYFLERSYEALPDLGKVLRLESARLAQRDAKCDVHVAAEILDGFAHDRLFWTINHPTNTMLRILINKILAYAGLQDRRFEGMSLDDAFFKTYFSGELLGPIAVPIHPKVAEHFDLPWYDPNEAWRYYGQTRSYTEYFREMIEYGVASRHARRGESAAT